MDTTTKAVIETIGDSGYRVEIGYTDGLPVVVAVNEKTGERFVVRGEDLYDTVVEVAPAGPPLSLLAGRQTNGRIFRLRRTRDRP